MHILSFIISHKYLKCNVPHLPTSKERKRGLVEDRQRLRDEERRKNEEVFFFFFFFLDISIFGYAYY